MPFVYFCINVTNAFWTCKPLVSFFLCVNTVVLKHEPLTLEWKGRVSGRGSLFTALLAHSDGTMWTNKGQRSGVPGAGVSRLA